MPLAENLPFVCSVSDKNYPRCNPLAGKVRNSEQGYVGKRTLIPAPMPYPCPVSFVTQGLYNCCSEIGAMVRCKGLGRRVRLQACD